MQFPEWHRAPARAYWEQETFFLHYESGRLLHSIQGKPRGLMLSTAQKYPVANSFFCLVSQSLSVPSLLRLRARKPGLYLSILLAEIREKEKAPFPTPGPLCISRGRFCFSHGEHELQSHARLGRGGLKSSKTSKLSRSPGYKFFLKKTMPYSCHL